jgi:hypothetical protein
MHLIGVRARTLPTVRGGCLLQRLKPLVPGGRGGGFGGRRIAYPDLHYIQNDTQPSLTAACPAPLAEVPPPGSTSGRAVVSTDRSPQD